MKVEKSSILKLITRTGLLVILLVSLSSLSIAQDGNASKVPPSAAAEYNADNWKVFFATDVSFHMKMPGKPTQSTMEIETPVSKLPHHVYLLRTEVGSYMVSFTEFPRLPNEPQEIKKTLDGLRNGITKDKNKKLFSEREVKIEGYIGRELLIRDGDNFVKCWSFLSGKRAYQILLSVANQTVFKTGKPSPDPSDFTDSYKMMSTQFFDSFKLINGGSVTAGSQDNATVDGRTRIVTGGVLNGRAIKLPAPSYPSAAKAAGVEGVVVVEILIDEEGRVIKAKAVEGHPLLQDEAVKAAFKARFTTTKLEGIPVKVAGRINYRFRLR